MSDMYLTGGTWQPADVYADLPDGGAVEPYLTERGWEQFLAVGDSRGDGTSAMVIRTWRRTGGDDGARYMLEVGDSLQSSPYLLVDTLPELLDLMARWAPIVQAAAVSYVVDGLIEYGINREGLVEMIAARVRFGADETHDRFRAQLLRDEEVRRARRAERKRTDGGQQ